MASPTTDRRLGLVGNTALKAPCDLATTANITLSGEQSIDGTTTSSSRVFVKNQTTTANNGIYDTSSGSWTRARDFDGAYDIVTGTIITVTGGTTNSHTAWLVTNTGTITIGTTGLTFASAVFSDASSVGFLQAGTGAIARTMQSKEREIVSVTDFYANGVSGVAVDPTGVVDSTLGIQAAIDLVGNYGAILFPQGVYKTTAALSISVTAIKLKLFSDTGAQINCAHTGHGINSYSTNENYGGHTFENLRVQGPNVSYPNSAGELAGTSTGGGINIHDGTTTNAAAGYGITLRNVDVQGFLYGLRMRAALACNMYGGSIRFNQYGVYFDGGQTNANHWWGTRIRENRIAGIWSAGTTGGSLTNATANGWHGVLLETNIPYRGDNPGGYSGGYPTAMDTSGTVGLGAYLYNSYDNVFDSDCYFENHNYSVVFAGSSDHNSVRGGRMDGGGNRVGGVRWVGAGAINNDLIDVHKNCTINTEINLKTDHADHSQASIIDCYGFNLIAASLVGVPYVRNLQLSQAGGGTPDGRLTLANAGIADFTGEGTIRGYINGIGTGTATLNMQGLGRVKIGSELTSATTVILFTSLTYDSLFVIHKTDSGFPLTFKSGAMGNGADIICRNALDAKLTAAGQMIFFWVNNSGQVVEIGRNFDSLQGSATYDPANLVDAAGATTTVTCTGAILGDFAEASFSLDLQGITLTAWVSAANTVSVRFQNESGVGIDLASGTLRVRTRSGL